MKKILFLCLMLFSLTCQAVRQEDNISQMVISMHHDFMFKWKDVQSNYKATEQKLLDLDTLLLNYSDNSKQCIMSIYSTNDNYFQDVAFACQNSLNLFNSFKVSTAKYVSMLNEYKNNVHRQDSLVIVLKSIDTKALNNNAQKLLPELLAVIGKRQAYDRQILQRLQCMKSIYNETYQRLQKAATISQQKYAIIRSNVLGNFDGNILNIINDWDGYMSRMEKSKAEQKAIDKDFNAKAEKVGVFEAITTSMGTANNSAWGTMRIAVIFIVICLIFLRAFFPALLLCLARWILKRVCRLKFWARTRFKGVADKILHVITYFGGIKILTLLTLWIDVLLWTSAYTDDSEGASMMDSIGDQVFYFAILFAVVITYFIFSYSGRRFWSSLAVCVPTILAFVYTLTSLIMVMSDDEIVVETTFLSILFFALQLLVSCLLHKQLDVTMSRISNMSVIFLGGTMIMALLGLQFLSSMVVTFWCNFMVFMLLLTSLKRFIDHWIRKYRLNAKSVKHNWWIPIIERVLYPMAWIYAALLSCKMAFSVYSLDDFLDHFLNTYFSTPLGNISLNVNLLIFICWNILLAAYLSKIIYQFVDYYHQTKGENNWKDTNLFNQSTIRFLVWGAAVVNIMINMGFSLAWVGYCMAGISTGLGFASREILENFIYGLTLRNGQLKIGDWIVCEGIRGQIKSIGLLSSRMDSVEGAVITFTNRRLVNMNYQNITLNHGYELLHTEFCVNFGEDIERLRKLLIDGYAQYDCYDKSRPVSVFVKQINNQQVDLDFKVWVLASDIIKMAAFNKEYVYNILNANGIQYPYTYINVNNV